MPWPDHPQRTSPTEDRMADGMDIDDGSFWTVRLQQAERVDTGEPEVDGENLFAVEFKAVGINMNAEIEVLVTDVADEAQVIVAALDALQDGLETWARVLARRLGADAIDVTGE